MTILTRLNAKLKDLGEVLLLSNCALVAKYLEARDYAVGTICYPEAELTTMSGIRYGTCM